MTNWQTYSGLLLAAITGSGNALGGWLVTLSFGAGTDPAATELKLKRLGKLTQIGAGILLAVTVLEFIPTALGSVRPHAWGPPLILLGYLVVHLIEHSFVPHSDLEAGPRADAAVSPVTVLSGVLGLSLHALFDGVAIGAAASLSRSLGALVFVAIMMHKIPVGATIASIALEAGLSGRKAFLSSAFVGAATPIGALLVHALSPAQMGNALGIGAGVMLYVAATELIPAGNEIKRLAVTCRVIIGVLLFVATQFLLKRVGLE